MIMGRITAKSQTTVPRAVRLALGLKPGDNLVWEIEHGRAVLRPVSTDDDGMISNFSTFTEWADEYDSVFDNL